MIVCSDMASDAKVISPSFGRCKADAPLLVMGMTLSKTMGINFAKS